MASSNHFSNNSKIEKINFRKEIFKYLKHWPWFFLGVVICLTCAFFYLRYETPLYHAKASIIIKDDAGNSMGSAIYNDLGMSGLGANNFDTEIGVLKSRRLMQEVVKSLNLNIQFFKEGKINTIEIYEDLPFFFQVLTINDSELKQIGGANFEISNTGNKFKIQNLITGKYLNSASGEPVDLGFANVVFSAKTGLQNDGLSDNTLIRFSNIEQVASHYRNQVNLIQPAKSSGLINLELKDPVKQKARDILDQLILEYNRDAIEDKNLIAGNTANFINDRLAIINGELDSVETGKEVFKEENRLTDIQAQSQLFIQNANDYNRKRQEVGTQLELSNAMLEYIGSNTQTNLLPSNLGIAEGGVNAQINDYNNLVLERNRILAGSSEKNPVVMRLNSQIGQIKQNVVHSLQRMRSNLQIAQEDLNRQASSIGSQIYAVPSKERQYRGIERQQNIKETLYLFLLQKREENSLSLAVTEPKAKIVDRAYYEDGAISPNSRNIYLGSFLLGIFLPFGVIYLKGMLDNKIRSRDDLEFISKNHSILGLIPRVSKKENIIYKNDRSILAESFRILITNLEYLMIHTKNRKGAKTLLVTSTIQAEGKTFTAINLAISLSNAGHKVLLLGTDLRNPKLQELVNDSSDSPGISDYLVNDHICLEHLIKDCPKLSGIHVLTSGTIPPNPYEILKQEKLKQMFDKLATQYEYIIIDSAPLMLVADTFLIAKHVDIVLYLVMAGYTDKELLQFPIDSQEQGKINNVSFIINGLKQNNLGYGNRYSYGYESKPLNFWQKRKNTHKTPVAKAS